MKDVKVWWSSHRLAVSAKRKEILAKRVYRAMHYGNSCSSNGESGDDAALPVPLPRLRPSTWKTATTEEITSPIRDSNVKNYFIYHKNPILGYGLTLGRHLKKARKFLRRGTLAMSRLVSVPS